MLNVLEGIRYRSFNAVRNNGSHNLGEELFIFHKEERDKYHGKYADGYVYHYGSHRAQDAGDRDVGGGALQIVEDDADGVVILADAGDGAGYPSVDVIRDVVVQQFHVAQERGLPDNAHHDRNDLRYH